MRRTVTVSGQGATRVVPDCAVVQVAASHRAAGVAEACAGVSSAIGATVELARRFTEPAEIASSGFNVWPAHDNEGRPVGFDARHSLTITVTDLSVAGQLLSALAEEIGDRLLVDGVSLEVADPGPAQVSARELAFADARARAGQLAALGEATLGEVVSVVEGGSTRQPLGHAEARLAHASTKDISFEPGEQSLSASVTVTWRLVDPTPS